MKTLTEQLYEYLLKEGNPVTVIDAIKNESFASVPPMVVGKGLLTICGEGLANYFMKDGKMYFTTDLSVGRGPIGSQSNMGNLTGALSALFGGASGDMSSFLGNMTKAFPDVGDSETDALIEDISFTAKAKGDDFEIAFPANPSEDLESDGEHEFVAMYENLPIASMTTKVNVVDGDFSEKSMKATIRGLCMNYIKKLYKCLDAPEEYVNDNATAFYLPASPNCFAFVARPDGIHILRIDWNFENGLPSKKVVFKFFERWLNTYKYFGKKQYTKLVPFDREELLKSPSTSDAEEKVLGEFENWLNEANRQANVIKASAGSEDGIDKPTAFFYRARKSLEEAAEIIDAVIVQATNVIKHYSAVKASDEFLNKLYTFAQITLDVASDVSANIKVNVSNIPYNSATDIALGASSTEDQTVQVFPMHYLEFLDLITTQRMATQATDAELQANIKAFAKEMKARYDIANKAPTYYPDFKMEGKMVAAYLGHAEEVEVPEFATRIGDYSFKNAKEMVSIVLGENVTSFGFCPFDGCSNLKVVKVLGDVAAINGPLTGFGGNPKFTIQSYKGSYIEKYCKENEVAFEAIKEDNLDCVIELNNTEYDVYQGFAFPKIIGFKTTQELSSADKKKLGADENTEHIQYGMVPADKSFAEYKDVNFSVTVVQDPLDVPQGGIQIAEEIEQRFNQPTLHGVYRTVKADKGKVLVRYDTTREGNDEGVQWATYVVVVARENKLLIMQIFFNGEYSHRQQQFAIDKWAGQILSEKSYKDKQKKLQEELRKAEEARKAEEKKRLEAEAKKKAEEEMRAWEAEVAPIKAQREADWEQFVAETDKATEEKKKVATSTKEKSIADKKDEIAKTSSELKSAQSELRGLGIFKISRKKELKDLIATLEGKLSKLNEDLPKIEEKYKGDIQAITNEATAKKNAYTKELDKKYKLPLSPAEKNKANKK